MDKNYWKEAYKEFWEVSSRKEVFVKELIKKETGFTVLEVGLGAGTKDFLSGSAADHGLVKGDADLYVVGADAYVEITGPLFTISPSLRAMEVDAAAPAGSETFINIFLVFL